jgi:V8-like Glu-specific endopeptidase
MSLPRLSAARMASACIGVILLASLALPAGGPAVAAPRHAGDADRTVAEVEAYWTPQRMEQAKPFDVVVKPDGSTGARAAESNAPAASTVAYSSFELTDTTSFPNRLHGKAFFSRPGAGNFVCSGTVVDAQNRATVITAGHCVHSAGVWSTNFAFAPGYRRLLGTGNAPYGVWAATDEAAPQEWVTSRNLRFDVGAAVIAKDSLGRNLEDVVGARAIAFNRPTSQSFRSYGYPAQPTASHAFDGMRLWGCDSAPPISDNPTSASGPATLGIGCDMTGGSSGGGWVNAGYLNGVNSYRYSNQPEMMYGPYFGPEVKALYDFAAVRAPGTMGSQAVGNQSPPASNPTTAVPKPVCKKRRKKAKRTRSVKRACKAKRAQPSASSAM